MSVDQELERALQEAEAEAAAVPAVAGAPEPSKPKPKRNLGLLVGLLVIVAGALVVVFSSGKDAAVYSVGVDQLLKESARYKDRSVRAKGMLVKGTLARRDDPCEYRFKLIENGSVLEVHHPACVVPDTFKDMPGMEVEVQAEGRLSDDGKTFVSNNIIAKCPSKYEMKQKSMAGEMAPHAGTQGSPLDTFAQKN
ncbi:MAG: cytochrome c maturation protein CcmE [Myxococcales bacterium]|nr:MAG: cytochrome c maturation protein CcmE [Myxococcales bacterium]